MSSPTHVYDELSRTVERLHRIVEATKLLNSTLDLEELTRIILQIAREEAGVERGTVFVLSPDGEHLRSLVAQEVDAEIEVRVGNGIAGTVAATGEIIDIPDAYKDSRFDRSFDSQLGFKTRDIYCMPVCNREGETIGVLQLLNRDREFSDSDRDFLAGISVHVGLALENASLHRQIVEKKRIEQELNLARDIQQAFQPNLPEAWGEVEVAGSTQMCHEVGGDYLSFFKQDDKRFIAMLGDVSGKGIGAALVMTSVHATCRALVKHVHSLERISFVLNDMLVESTQGRSFVTLLIMLYDPGKRRIHLISAGHNPPVLVEGSGVVRLLKEGGGPPAGLFRGIQYTREVIDVEPGSVFVAYTDGVSEAENESEDQYGLDRLSIVVRRNASRPAAEIHEAISRSIAEFSGEAPANDDITMLVLKF